MTSPDCHPENLLLYHYDELEANTRERLEAHLVDCPFCRQELARLEQTLALNDQGRVSLSPLETERFAQRVVAATKTRRSLRTPAWGLALSTAGALCLLLVLSGPEPAPPFPDQSQQVMTEFEILQDFELLDDLDLLEELELLQELENLG